MVAQSIPVPGLDLRSFLLKEPLGWPSRRRDLQSLFDQTPILEAREALIKQMGVPGFQEEIDWAITRIWSFLNIPLSDSSVYEDFTTALLLLHSIVYAPEYYQEQIFSVILEALERALRPARGAGYGQRGPVKDLVVIMCGHLTHRPKSYNEQARELIKSIFQQYGSDTVGREDEGERVLQRLLVIIQKVGDTSFLPLIEKLVMPMIDPKSPRRGLDNGFRYLSISHEQITTDALARQALAYLTFLND